MKLRRHRRLRKILAWGTMVLIASLGGGLWYAFYYATDSANVIRLIQEKVPKYLPGARVEIDRARLGLIRGEVHLTIVKVIQTIDGRPFPALKIPWLNIRHNPKAMLEGRFEPTEIVVAQPTLRLCRRLDGSWNVQGLIASPFPDSGVKSPPIQINNGTVELCEGEMSAKASAILRDVTVQVEPAGPGRLKFEGSAKGDTFDRITLAGTVETATGKVELHGDLARLVISDPIRSRLPAEVRPAVEQINLTGGEADLLIHRIAFDPAATPKLSYEVSGHLRGGVWNCPKLPFPINDLAGAFLAKDGVLTVEGAKGYYGPTTVRVDKASISLADPTHEAFSLAMSVRDLKLDDKLQQRTPPEFQGIWRELRPSGSVDVSVRAGRAAPGMPLIKRVEVLCNDVAMVYRHFAYPLEHISGKLVYEGNTVTIEEMRTLVEGRPLTAKGTIVNPGPRSEVVLDFSGQGLPVNQVLFEALPPDVRAVVEQFNPTGTVGGTARVHRVPSVAADGDPRGKVTVDAYLDLNERCGIVWKGLPYPVNNMTGRLEIHPDLWIFKDIHGFNGQAEITGSGRVEKIGGSAEKPALKVALDLRASKLPFDDQLRTALPPAWRKTWAILDPTGSSDVTAAIRVEPGKKDSYVIEILPRPATSVRLRYTRPPKLGVDIGGTFELPMEHVTGRFVFDNGPVEMHDVGFRFFNAPVRFESGRVTVKDSGQFDLEVRKLWARDIRLDTLTTIMPPIMKQFAQRFEDGRTFALKGNLALGWSGVPGESVRCAWNNTKVIFIDNTIQIQPGLNLEHIQGELDNVHGSADGDNFEAHGAVSLASVVMRGQQITKLESPIDVEKGEARLDNVSGRLLDGKILGRLKITLDATPRYAAKVSVDGADMRKYAMNLSGRQTYRGLVSGRLELNGFGGDPRTLQGNGEAHIVNGALGELPIILSLLKLLNRSPATKTAFDSADVFLTVENGKTVFDEVVLTGNAVSLRGNGTMDVQGDLDLKLPVVYGRDRMHLRGISDLVREASGKLMVVTVKGTPSFPKPKLELLPEASGVLKAMGQRREHVEMPRR